MKTHAPIKQRFERYFTRGKKSECWLWFGFRNVTGYGMLSYSKAVPILAHRLSYILHKGKIPTGLHILHTCDTPACVNPNHLVAGTPLDNMRDAMNKGRMQRGEKRWNAKLTPSIVRAIRADARPQFAIAQDYKIDPSLVSYVKRRKIWKHVQ